MGAGSRDIVAVGLVQINNSFSGQNYLPYSIALLESYVRKYAVDPARYQMLPSIYKRLPVGRAVDRLQEADVLGFSTYVWNGRISLEIVRRLKLRKPDQLIIFGGPHVPDDPEQFLRENGFVDLVVHNEGEQTFLKLLERFPSRDWDDIPGISYLDAEGVLKRNANAPRIRDLEDIPSPFLDGTFDRLIAAELNESWIGLWETNRGCPFQCTFCDWGSATAAKVNKFEEDRLKAEVDWFARNRIEYIFCCDANFGILKRDIDLATYVAAVKAETGYPKALSVQNTKNATDRAYETQKILSDAGLNKGVALSMQTVDLATLVNIKRDNISLDTYTELQRRFARDKVETYSDLILGLPGETFESFADGINTLIETGQHNRIQFNNLSILPNAEMGDIRYQQKFGMEVVESEIINVHGQKLVSEDDVSEVQSLVIATASMPRADWRRARSFAWMTAFLYFDKLCQLPIVVARELSGLSYRTIIQAVHDASIDRFPLVAGIRDFFMSEAASIQQGGAEYVYSGSGSIGQPMNICSSS
jgi:tRNA A37 methylthiotransferase MiaB